MTSTNILRIIRIWKKDKYIGIMLNTAECVYFHNFANTIYTETTGETNKAVFNDFKNDIVKHNWDVEKLILIWVNTGKK